MKEFRTPIATYRLQFSLGFRFVDARDLVPYLHELGVTDVYASPRFKARRGSSHGYDVADPLTVNSELGTEQEFEELVQKVRYYGMGLLLDIVPNHMAASPENPWWMDVLENGASSPYAAYFDINWHPVITKAGFLQEGRILLPILEDLYGNVLEDQGLTLKFDEHGFFVRYHDIKLPLDPKTYRPILDQWRKTAGETLGPDHPACSELSDLIKEVESMPSRAAIDSEELTNRKASIEAVKGRLWQLYTTYPNLKLALERAMRAFNGECGESRSFDRLDELLDNQAYRPAFWKLAAEEINYRRFFDVSDLVGLRLEEPKVFDARHRQILDIIRNGKVNGLRVDHIDGLYDPLEYLQRLQGLCSNGRREKTAKKVLYIIVEKILSQGETLPAEWPVCGTTGYDFIHVVNGIFIDPQGLQNLGKIYSQFTGKEEEFGEICYRCKRQVMLELFAGEVNMLTYDLAKLAAFDRHARDVPLSEYRQALVEVTAGLPVYRTYIRDFEISQGDRERIRWAFQEAERRTPETQVGPPAFAFLRSVLLINPTFSFGKGKEECLRFVMRWQQFTGAVMAKGFEDTALYNYHRLLSMNEVGGNPGGPPASVEEFHQIMKRRSEQSPGTLNATSTHDTKRSEDVRARLNVLSELSLEWGKCLERWSRLTLELKEKVAKGAVRIHPDEEMFIYQNLLGAWPLDPQEVPSFKERLAHYVLKAAREAKAHTSWIHPDSDYESAILSFTDAITQSPQGSKFLKDFLRFWRTVAPYGMLNSLSQVLLKVTAPGVPDFYQGTELWDFSLVDPDNRRPVDFHLRLHMLENLRRESSVNMNKTINDLVSHWEDGRIKLFITDRALDFRKAYPDLFLSGSYIPLDVTGSLQKHVCAFARKMGNRWALTLVPRYATRLVGPNKLPLGRRVWGTTSLVMPKGSPKYWVNVLTGKRCNLRKSRHHDLLRVHEVLGNFPVALLAGSPTHKHSLLPWKPVPRPSRSRRSSRVAN